MEIVLCTWYINMIICQIACNKNAHLNTYKISNRAFKWIFLAIANIQLRYIWGYNIENTRGWKIYNKGWFEAILRINNVQHRPIWIQREHTGTHRNSRELTKVHRSTEERRYNVQKGHRKFPINTQTSTHLPSAVVVAAVIFLWCCCGDCLDKNSTPKFLTHNQRSKLYGA